MIPFLSNGGMLEFAKAYLASYMFRHGLEDKSLAECIAQFKDEYRPAAASRAK